MTLPPVLVRAAVLSDCGRWRYRLFRKWEVSEPERMPVLWIMWNPSTADGVVDDPTIRRCMAFSHAWGYGSLLVGNLYALRSTDPGALEGSGFEEAVGPENARHVHEMAERAALIVCAWGAFRRGRPPPFSLWSPGGLWCLGRTKNGEPRHPLYAAASTALARYSLPGFERPP